VTTQDWGLNDAEPDNGARRRPHSAVEIDFVHEVQGTAADLAWLRSNIFGSSAAGAQAADDFVARVTALTAVPRRAHARTYWIWPLYAWPDELPVGLRDKTVLSLAWSLSKRAPAASLRLLSLPRVGEGRRIMDLYHQRIDVRRLTLPPAGVLSARPVHPHVRRKPPPAAPRATASPAPAAQASAAPAARNSNP